MSISIALELCYTGTVLQRWQTRSSGSRVPRSFGTVWERSLFCGSCNGSLGKFRELRRLFFLEFPRSLGLGNTKHIDKYVEPPTKHEALLKPSQEERPKASLTPIILIEKLEQSLDGLRKRVTAQCKSDIWDVMLMSIFFFMYMYRRRLCAYCMWQSMLNHQSRFTFSHKNNQRNIGKIVPLYF